MRKKKGGDQDKKQDLHSCMKGGIYSSVGQNWACPHPKRDVFLSKSRFFKFAELFLFNID